MTTWPPILDDLKNDLEIPPDDEADDEALQRRLYAAVSFVERVRLDLFVTAEDEDGGLILIEPVEFTAKGEREAGSIVMGVFMLAGRLFARRRSQDAILWMAETGTTRVPFDDGDISRLLRIGRHQRMLLA